MESLTEKHAIAMSNCKVQTDSKGIDTIFINEFSEVQKSPKKFIIPDSHTATTTAIEICELSSLANNTKVSVTIKLIEVSPQETICAKGGKCYKKQDCIIADSSGCARLVLWGEDINTLMVGSSYKLISVGVRCFNNINYLSVSGDSQILPTSDIGDVEAGDVDRLVMSHIIEGETIAARCIEYSGCSTCKVKIYTIDGLVGECSKCRLMVKMTKCSKFFTTNIRVNDNDNKSHDLKT